MNINKVTAIFDEFRLKNVEETLIRHGVKDFTLHLVRGRLWIHNKRGATDNDFQLHR
ncbi:hypothetical protein [Spongiibacter tropicus]|uniref:hypothetical protein n=1 Tax=Spongiibacter tropicus TaxID=454602 RepID=UPI0003B79920|nr:hypothetical protein [Spongiibacter tropicus]